MQTVRWLGGSLLALAFASACSDTFQPTGPGATSEQARLGQSCVISDDARAQVRTVSADCTNQEVTVPEGWTLRVIGESAAAAPSLPSVGPQQITQIDMPTPEYVAATDLIDLSDIPDFTVLTSVTDGVQTVSFNVTMQKRSVPGSWATWGAPPYTEGAFPHVLFSDGAGTIEIVLSEPARIFGFELSPNPFELHSYTVHFHSGFTLVGSITRQIHGDGGARLLAARSEGASFDRIVIAGTADFAIARLRYALGDPPTPVEIHALFSGPPNREPGQIHLQDPNVFVQILNIEEYLGRTASPSDVRIGPNWETGTPAEEFTIADLNQDGILDIQLRFDTQQLINDGHLGAPTTQLIVWGRDQATEELYRGEAEVEIIGGGGVIDQYQPSAVVYMAAFYQEDLAQSFQTQQSVWPTVGAGIFLQPGIGGTDLVRISLWTALPNEGGTLLRQGEVQGTQGQWVDVFWEPILLEPNTTYYLVFDGNVTLGIAGDITNPYPYGHVFANPGFEPYPDFDYTFRTWIAPPGGGAFFTPAQRDQLRTMAPSGAVRPWRFRPVTTYVR